MNTVEGGVSAMTDMANTIAPLKEALVGSITPAQIVAVLAAMVGVGMTFVLMWFGVRKLISIFKKAVTRGKISV